MTVVSDAVRSNAVGSNDEAPSPPPGLQEENVVEVVSGWQVMLQDRLAARTEVVEQRCVVLHDRLAIVEQKIDALTEKMEAFIASAGNFFH